MFLLIWLLLRLGADDNPGDSRGEERLALLVGDGHPAVAVPIAVVLHLPSTTHNIQGLDRLNAAASGDRHDSARGLCIVRDSASKIASIWCKKILVAIKSI